MLHIFTVMPKKLLLILLLIPVFAFPQWHSPYYHASVVDSLILKHKGDTLFHVRLSHNKDTLFINNSYFVGGGGSSLDTTWTDNGFASKKQTSKRDTIIIPKAINFSNSSGHINFMNGGTLISRNSPTNFSELLLVGSAGQATLEAGSGSSFGGAGTIGYSMTPGNMSSSWTYVCPQWPQFGYQLDEWGFYPTGYSASVIANQRLGWPNPWRGLYIDSLAFFRYMPTDLNHDSIWMVKNNQFYKAPYPSVGTTYTATSPVQVVGSVISLRSDTLTSWYTKWNEGVHAYNWGNWQHTTLSGYGITDAFHKADTNLNGNVVGYYTYIQGLAGKQASLGFTPENVSNKTDHTATSASLYPTWRAAKAYDDSIAGLKAPAFTASSNGYVWKYITGAWRAWPDSVGGGGGSVDTTTGVGLKLETKYHSTVTYTAKSKIIMLFPSQFVDTSALISAGKVLLGYSVNITIDTLIIILNRRAGTPSITPNVYFGTDWTAAGTSIITSPSAVTSYTTVTKIYGAALQNTAISAGNQIWGKWTLTVAPKELYFILLGHYN